MVKTEMAVHRFDIESLLPPLSEGFTLITPNNRTVDGILREYANNTLASKEAESAWRRPQVIAVDIFLQQLWQRAASLGIAPFNELLLLSRYDEQQTWLQIVEASYADYPLLNSEETANSAARSYQIYTQWNVVESASLERYRNAVDFQTFLDWSKKFEAHCDRAGVVSLSDAGRLITDHIETLDPLLPPKMLLVNFTEPPPLYQQLFDALSSVCELRRQQISADQTQLSEAFSQHEGTLWRFQSDRSEVETCLDWCTKKALENPNAHIGIVLDHSRSLEPLIEEALFRTQATPDFDVDRHINRYRSNETLAAIPEYNAALNILALNHDLVESERFCKILQSSLTVGSESESSPRIALELVLRRNAEDQLRLSQLRPLMLQTERDYHCPILAQALLQFSELARHAPKRQSLRSWLKLFCDQLTELGWPGPNATDRRERLAKQWQKHMQRLAASSQTLGNISLLAALAKLQAYLKQTNVNLGFDDRLQVSLLDIEEAQDMVFDHVWLLAVDERNWPRPVSPVPFLPYSLQQELGLPATSNQQQLSTARVQLARLRDQTTQEMVISYHCLEEELKLRPSPLIRSLEFSDTLDETPDAKTERVSGKLERFQDPLHLPLTDSEEIRGGTSLLSNQSNCPFRAFASNRLRAAALEGFSHGLNPLLRGNALHRALEQLGMRIADSKTLHGLSSSELEKLLAASADDAINYLRTHNPETMTPAFSQLEHERLSALMRDFLEIEKQRGEFSIEHNEKAVNWSHSKLALNLRIDRIDRLADGTLALIDFKTGKYANYKWHDPRPDDMQLPLYQIAIDSAEQGSVAATLICQLNAENIGYLSPVSTDGFGKGLKVSSQAKTFEGGWPELQSRWNEIIVGLIAEFEAGLLAVAPTRGYTTCQYCDLGPLCRIAESETRSYVQEEQEPP